GSDRPADQDGRTALRRHRRLQPPHRPVRRGRPGGGVRPPRDAREVHPRLVKILMVSLSSVGLMVGGVGVVAIMMISVTERTREIGVRKALGATRQTILWQFLVEAATLTLVGGIVGMIVGSAVAFVVRATSPIPASITVSAIALSLASAALTGIAFGLMPAARAARMDPVEALRYE